MRHYIKNVSKTLLQNHNAKTTSLIRFLTTQEGIERRHHLFTLEIKRQIEKVGRIEKIEVKYKGVPKECTLIMNKDISTPYNCAQHLSQWHMESSALAVIDDTVHWDMHRPLHENCTLQFQNFLVKDPYHVNRAFWRTCSLIVGACATISFKDNIPVMLHSFPGPNIQSGSFIYDIDIPSLEDWKPTKQEMMTLTAEIIKFIRQNHAIERLQVGEELALEMFVENQHKSKQIPSIAKNNNGVITLYKVGKHVDISKGPMISNTSQIGRISLASVHKLIGSPDSEVKQLYRFQGVALPTGTVLNHFAFTLLTQRASKLNSAKSPINLQQDYDHSNEKQTFAAKA